MRILSQMELTNKKVYIYNTFEWCVAYNSILCSVSVDQDQVFGKF